MNPDDPFSFESLQDLLGRLRSVLEKFAARETALERDHHLQLHRERESAEEIATRLGESLDHRIETAAAAHEEQAARLKARDRNRRSRIDKAHKSSRNRVARTLAEQEGHRVYQLQMAMIQQKRNLSSEREQAHQRHEANLAELAQEREALAKLRKAASRGLRGIPSFAKALFQPSRNAENETDTAPGETLDSLMARAREARAQAGETLRQFRRLPVPRLFAGLPASLIVMLLILAGAGAAFGLPHAGFEPSLARLIGGGIVVGGLILVAILFAVAKAGGSSLATTLVGALHECREAQEAGQRRCDFDYQAALARLDSETEQSSTEFDQARKQSPEMTGAERTARQQRLDEQAARLLARHAEIHQRRSDALAATCEAELAAIRTEGEAGLAEAKAAHEAAQAKLVGGYNYNWNTLETEWRAAIQPIDDEIKSIRRRADEAFPEWSREFLERWKAPSEFANAARMGSLDVDVNQLASARPQNPRLALTVPETFSLPISLSMPHRGSVLMESDGFGREEMLAGLNQMILRLLSVAPPAKLSFTIIDPVGLGDGFSGLMHLADYDESLINSRIWTQGQQIEARLGDLNDHIEKVIQMYLRNEFTNITEYNRQAGKISEKYHFVVIADFPANFSELAAKRLLSIANSGARCGVYLLMHWDRKKPAPQDFVPDQVRAHCLRVVGKKGELTLGDESIPGATFRLDRLPDDALTNDLIHKLGAASRDAERVEVPFSDIAPADDAIWSIETTKEMRVPIGRTGATKLQYLAIGRDTRQHALIAGKTGSGKSTLFHVMITNLSLWCSPDEVEFYLVDFKKGVEFKCYATAKLPHARVIAIESDREFGLSVLQRLDEELKRRGDLFRQLGVQDLPGYEKAGGKEPIPRTLLLIDEFQEFFVEDDRIAQNANVLMDRIVRQGRAFGIHVILGSQTLGGAYTLARTTLGQMVIRIALQCNEADAYLIMDDSNPAPRLLTRPGEGIYNDQAGMIEGNSPFQVVWLPDEVREAYLEKVSQKAAASPREFPAPIVFEGNAPAEIRDNVPLRKAIAAFPPERAAPEIHLWLGAPNAIKGPTQAVFQRQSGNHLLIIGQRDEAALAMLAAGMVGLSAQFPREAARFVLFDSSAPETPEREQLELAAGLLPHPVAVARGHDIDTAMAALATELDRRQHDEAASATAPATFVLVNGLQRIKKLKYEEDFSFSLDDTAGASPGTQFNNLIADGPALGIHVIATCDTYNNLNRVLSRKALSEFEMRVLFQMSANDSASLIDSPKASGLGLHRALFYNESEGYLETFRPYALPDREWFEDAGKALARP